MIRGATRLATDILICPLNKLDMPSNFRSSHRTSATFYKNVMILSSRSNINNLELISISPLVTPSPPVKRRKKTYASIDILKLEILRPRYTDSTHQRVIILPQYTPPSLLV